MGSLHNLIKKKSDRPFLLFKKKVNLLFILAIVPHAAIGHQGFLKMAMSKLDPEYIIFHTEVGFTEVCSAQLGFIKMNTVQRRPLEGCLSQIIADLNKINYTSAFNAYKAFR